MLAVPAPLLTKFQFLIGKLKTTIGFDLLAVKPLTVSIPHRKAKDKGIEDETGVSLRTFQFLIGKLKTRVEAELVAGVALFQFLIGKLKTGRLCRCVNT